MMTKKRLFCLKWTASSYKNFYSWTIISKWWWRMIHPRMENMLVWKSDRLPPLSSCLWTKLSLMNNKMLSRNEWMGKFLVCKWVRKRFSLIDFSPIHSYTIFATTLMYVLKKTCQKSYLLENASYCINLKFSLFLKFFLEELAINIINFSKFCFLSFWQLKTIERNWNHTNFINCAQDSIFHHID